MNVPNSACSFVRSARILDTSRRFFPCLKLSVVLVRTEPGVSVIRTVQRRRRRMEVTCRSVQTCLNEVAQNLTL
jgi:hypothetical protein